MSKVDPSTEQSTIPSSDSASLDALHAAIQNITNSLGESRTEFADLRTQVAQLSANVNQMDATLNEKIRCTECHIANRIKSTGRKCRQLPKSGFRLLHAGVNSIVFTCICRLCFLMVVTWILVSINLVFQEDAQ